MVDAGHLDECEGERESESRSESENESKSEGKSKSETRSRLEQAESEFSIQRIKLTASCCFPLHKLAGLAERQMM